jgi:hypothetical protein
MAAAFGIELAAHHGEAFGIRSGTDRTAIARFRRGREAMGGMRYVTGYPDRPPVRMGISIGDSIAALHGVIGAMMALHQRNVKRRQRSIRRCRAV